jgi:hypothetical protein
MIGCRGRVVLHPFHIHVCSCQCGRAGRPNCNCQLRSARINPVHCNRISTIRALSREKKGNSFLIGNGRRVERCPFSYFRCQSKKYRFPRAQPHRRASMRSVFSSVRSVQSVSKIVNALNRAALARNGNRRSGRLQQNGKYGLNGFNGWENGLHWCAATGRCAWGAVFSWLATEVIEAVYTPAVSN